MLAMVGSPGQQVIAEVGERMAEGRQFPVEDGDDLRAFGVDHQVAEAVVAMHHRGLGIVGEVFRQPFDEAVHGGYLALLRHQILLRPARDLAREIAAGLTESCEAAGAPVDAVERRQTLVHSRIDTRPFAASESGMSTRWNTRPPLRSMM